MEGKPDELSSVGVAVRVRPLNSSEKVENSQVCVTVDHKERHIIMGKDRSFTFDQVFGPDSKQVSIFESCTKDLVFSVFAGYNATVLAYGQTGSGKTFTMGSGQVTNMKEEDIGIIPRVIEMIFQEVDKRKNQAEFIIKVSFLEIYNEEIHDLLEANSMVPEKPISIREDKGSIFLMGLHEEKVMNCEEMLTCLERGSLQRIVASTLMNANSSRSHAIFTINIEQQVIEVQPEVTEGQEYMIAKFHFVDLAGSERAKRTGAVGATLREGISINKGLLCLGNVISALTEDSGKKAHVPYRDSKLTRILQDSLGGNAKTYMIACISPAEINFEETLNTLKYASRARNIKNKPVINRDPQSAIISALKQEVNSLKIEIKGYQKILENNCNDDIKACLDNMKKDFGEKKEDEELKTLNSKLQQTEKKLQQANIDLELSKKALTDSQLEFFSIKKDRDLLKIKQEKYMNVIKANGLAIEDDDESSLKLVDEYSESIEKLKQVNESKDRLIVELQGIKENLEKALDRESKLLQKKTEELQKLKREQKGPSVDLSQVLLKNVDDYGRMFAETIMATLQKHPDEEAEEIETIESEVQPAEEKSQQEELLNVEGKIKEKEEIMKNIEEAFRDLQSQLIEEMSKQYYKKIEELEIEKKNTEKDRDLALERIKEGSSSDKQEVAEKFKSKIQALEDRLKENKRKDKELTTMQKLVETQKVQLAKLDEEIRKAKTDRIRLQKKIKEENEEIQKWKMAKQKEILIMKKSGIKKDQEIQFLKSENRKKEFLAKKKTEEVAALQRRQKEVVQRKKNPAPVNLDVLNQWVQEYTAACIDEREIAKAMDQEIQEKEECEKEIQELNSIYSQKKLKIERFDLILAENEPGVDQDELYSATITLNQETEEINERIDILQDKIKRKTELVLGYSAALANSRIEEIKSRALTISSLEESQHLVTVLFDDVLAKASELKQVNKVIQAKDAEIEYREQLKVQAEQEIELIIKKYENEISKMKTEFKVKECAILEELSNFKYADDEETSFRKSMTSVKETKKDQEIEKKEVTTPRIQAEYRQEEEKVKAKPNPFTNLNKARESAKKRRAGILDDDDKKFRKSPIGRPSNSKPNPEEDSSAKTTPNKTRAGSEVEVSTKVMQKWKLVNNVDAQKGPIYSMVTQENILYSASSQTIKVWSLDTLTSISEINAHNSLIKALAIAPENSIIASSCNNIIKLWDTVSLQTVGTLPVQMEEIRVIKMVNLLLYSVGKSNETGNSLYIWDLRKSQQPIYENERSQDIFSLSISGDSFNYSRKSHNVCKKLMNDEAIQLYEPAHLNTITGLTMYNEQLVSCSRDRSLKNWDSSGNCIAHVANAHTDWVNCVEVDCLQRHIYSGGKEGKIKVWRGEKMKPVGEMLGLNTSVFCISSVSGNEPVVVTAGNDKSFKIWKMLEEYSES